MAEYTIGSPLLLLITGVPGSGKSTLARALTRAIADACYLSKDMVQSPFTTDERVTGEAYAAVTGPTYWLLMDFAKENLALGKIPVIDAPMSINAHRQDEYSHWCRHWREAAEACNASLAIVRMRPPDEATLKARIRARGAARDKGKLEAWEQFTLNEPIDFRIDHGRVHDVVSNTAPDLAVHGIVTEFLGGTRWNASP